MEKLTLTIFDTNLLFSVCFKGIK